MKPNFSFDARVSAQYQAQRAHPPEVSQAVGAAIAAQVGGSGAHVLEIGIGTGRIARPVLAAGCRVTGFDVSAEMLAELDTPPIPPDQRARLWAMQADMHHIPLRDRCMDGVLAVHVLHLARDVGAVLREAARLLRPGGVFIEGNDWLDPQSVLGVLRDELRAQAAALMPTSMPPSAQIDRAALLASLGASERAELVAAEWTITISPAERLKAIAERRDNESWILPDEVFAAILPRLYERASALWGDLDAPQPVTRRFTMQRWRGDWHSA